MQTALIFLASIAILSCGKVPTLGPATSTKLATASEDDCGFVQNSYGQRVSWKQSLPLKIYIDPSFPTEYDPVVQKAAQKWEESLGRTLFIFERTAQASTPARDLRNVLYWLDPWTDANTNLQALTSLSWSRNQLVESDVKVDGQYFSYFVETPNSNNEVHLESLLVHEFGHVLGLKHVSTPSISVMLPVLDFLLKRDAPSVEDVAHLKCEYN